MSTVPNLPAATTIAPTDLLWLTQGTGADRDVKATVEQVGQAGITGLPAATLYRDNEFPVMQQGIAAARHLGEDLFPMGVDLAFASTEPLWNVPRGVEEWTPFTDLTTSRMLTIVRTPPIIGSTSPLFRLALSAVMSGLAGSSAYTENVRLTFNGSSLPSGWGDSLLAWASSVHGLRRIPVWVVPNSGAPVDTWARLLYSTGPVFDIRLGTTWAALMPVELIAGASIHLAFDTDPIDLVEGLPS